MKLKKAEAAAKETEIVKQEQSDSFVQNKRNKWERENKIHFVFFFSLFRWYSKSAHINDRYFSIIDFSPLKMMIIVMCRELFGATPLLLSLRFVPIVWCVCSPCWPIHKLYWALCALSFFSCSLARSLWLKRSLTVCFPLLSFYFPHLVQITMCF